MSNMAPSPLPVIPAWFQDEMTPVITYGQVSGWAQPEWVAPTDPVLTYMGRGKDLIRTTNDEVRKKADSGDADAALDYGLR